MLSVVFHINELAKWPMALGNIRNLSNEQPNISIHVVVNGSAIVGYVEPDFCLKIASLLRDGVCFEACRNAMIAQQLVARDLPEKVQVVPAGILRLVELQHQGFAYIKP